MRMILQRLAPGVQNGDRAHLRAEVARVCRNVAQRLGSGTEQKSVDDALVLEGDLRGRRWQCEDYVVLGYRQQVSLARLEPLGTRQALALRTVPVATGVVGVPDQSGIM
jgi:hypothetical protein